MTGFGRKGMAPGEPMRSPAQAMAMRAGAASATPAQQASMSPQLAAFLAQERAAGHQVQGGLSDIATSSSPYAAENAKPVSRGNPGGPGVGGSGLAGSVGAPRSDRSMLIAYILWWFGPVFGAHRFYLRAYRSGAAMAGLFWGGLVLGAFMSHQSTFKIGSIFVPPLWAAMILVWIVWVLVDLFLIPGLTKKTNAPRPELAFS